MVQDGADIQGSITMASSWRSSRREPEEKTQTVQALSICISTEIVNPLYSLAQSGSLGYGVSQTQLKTKHQTNCFMAVFSELKYSLQKGGEGLRDFRGEQKYIMSGKSETGKILLSPPLPLPQLHR